MVLLYFGAFIFDTCGGAYCLGFALFGILADLVSWLIWLTLYLDSIIG